MIMILMDNDWETLIGKWVEYQVGNKQPFGFKLLNNHTSNYLLAYTLLYTLLIDDIHKNIPSNYIAPTDFTWSSIIINKLQRRIVPKMSVDNSITLS